MFEGLRFPNIGALKTSSLLASSALALALAVGLALAWFRLDLSSLWTDELFTRWVVTGDGVKDTVFSRISTDVHPPAYYLIVFVYSQVFGTSDVALRSLSALCACLAVITFLLGVGPTVTLGGRLFGAAIATSSPFWFYQSQNARDYALDLLVGSAALGLSLWILRDRDQGKSALWRLTCLMGLLLFGALTHFYMALLSVAILGVLFLYLPRRRLILAIGACAIVLVSALYIEAIVKSHARFSLSNNWVKGNFDWYWVAAKSAIRQAAGPLAVVAILLCAIVAALRHRNAFAQSFQRAAFAAKGRIVLSYLQSRPEVTLALIVPIAVFVEGVASSVLVGPNLTDRNLLIAAPFVWLLCTIVYEAAFKRGTFAAAPAAKLVVCALVLAGSTVAFGRSLPRNETYKESAQWIKAVPSCQGAIIPVIETGLETWAEPQFTKRISRASYDRYLAGYAQTRLIYQADVLAGDVPGDLKIDIARRLLGSGCPVIAWSEHSFSLAQAQAAGDALAHSAGFASRFTSHLQMRSFPTYSFGMPWREDAPGGYLILVDRSDASRSGP